MCDQARQGTYLEIWSCIQAAYFGGYMVSEHGLQAALYAELQALPDVHVIVEPTWIVGGERMKPDLVIVEKEQITDIFELKFKPEGNAPFKRDIQKLLQYGVNEEGYPVRLNPNTGQWEENLPVRNKCCLHFVAVANYNAAAVWPQDLVAGVPELRENLGRLNHWFGRVGGDTDGRREWSIEFGI